MIYLDSAATTEPSADVIAAMNEGLPLLWGNPSSPHAKGRQARAVIDEARQYIAKSTNLKPSEVIFTGGGSESITLAIVGYCKKWQKNHGKTAQIISQKTEHKAVLNALESLKQDGWDVHLLSVDNKGHINLEELKNSLAKDTALVSIQWANNETGTVQPIEEIQQLCTERSVTFHTDAMQCIGILDLPHTPPDMMSIAAHKFYGPKGIGALLCKEHIDLEPIIHGGGQEHALRSGTENALGILGLHTAFREAIDESRTTSKHHEELRNFFIPELQKIGGSIRSSNATYLPNIVNVAFPEHQGETLVIQLDMNNICTSTGSACTTGSTDSSHVLLAMGYTNTEARQSIRFSFSKHTTIDELKKTFSILQKVLQN